ncbi:MAG: HEAT repeat domain-containing protein, partial [Acidobacteriota bacterium]
SVLAATVVSAFGQSNLDDLRNKIANGSVENKRDALFAIRNLHNAEASRIAVPALSDADAVVRATAAAAIGFLPESEVAVYLRPLLSDKDAFVRREAAYALRHDRTGIDTSALVKLLFEDKVMEVRTAAAVALGSGDAVAIDALSRVLAKKPKDDDEFLRRSAARSIGRIAQIIRTGENRVDTPKNFLPEKYKDKKPAAEPVTNSVPAFRAALPILVRVLSNGKESDDTRREAAFALGAIGDASSVELLRSKLNSPDNYLAEICKEALLKIETANK